jgi:hypothetical protein
MPERIQRRRTDKVFLGDGVYAQWNGESATLTTEDGISITNTIYLKIETIAALLDYFLRLKGFGEEIR